MWTNLKITIERIIECLFYYYNYKYLILIKKSYEMWYNLKRRVMEEITNDWLKLLDLYGPRLKQVPKIKTCWEDSSQPFAGIYKKCNNATKQKAEEIYGKNFINKVVEYANKKNIIDFEKDYKKITNYETPDESWRLYAWGCANCFDNSTEDCQIILIEKYGKDFINKVIKYREDMHKRNRKLYFDKLSKDVAKDIVPIMPLLDNECGILFYSKKKNKLYVFDSTPILMLSPTKQNIKTNKYKLSWSETTCIYQREEGTYTIYYYPNNDKILVSAKKSVEILSYYAGIYEPIDEKNEKIEEVIESISSKLRNFDNNYFNDKKNDFLKTKEYLRNHLKINCF